MCMEFLHLINTFPVGDIRYFQYENSNFVSVEAKSKFSWEIYDEMRKIYMTKNLVPCSQHVKYETQWI